MNRTDKSQFITIEECDRKIEQAIDRHNKTATLISASLGGVLLFFYADGVMRMVEKLAS